jgi:hypothetical protein
MLEMMQLMRADLQEWMPPCAGFGGIFVASIST